MVMMVVVVMLMIGKGSERKEHLVCGRCRRGMDRRQAGIVPVVIGGVVVGIGAVWFDQSITIGIVVVRMVGSRRIIGVTTWVQIVILVFFVAIVAHGGEVVFDF